jgi:hypothetical protein
LGPRGPPAHLKGIGGQSSGNAVADETAGPTRPLRAAWRRKRCKTKINVRLQTFTAHNEIWSPARVGVNLGDRVATTLAHQKQQSEGEMVKKVAGLARLLAIVLAIVAGFVAIPNINVALILVVLGLIAGIAYDDTGAVRLFLTVLVLGPVAGALGAIPEIGDELGAVALNVALAAAGAAATVIAIRLFNNSRADVTGLTAK